MGRRLARRVRAATAAAGLGTRRCANTRLFAPPCLSHTPIRVFSLAHTRARAPQAPCPPPPSPPPSPPPLPPPSPRASPRYPSAAHNGVTDVCARRGLARHGRKTFIACLLCRALCVRACAQYSFYTPFFPTRRVLAPRAVQSQAEHIAPNPWIPTSPGILARGVRTWRGLVTRLQSPVNLHCMRCCGWTASGFQSLLHAHHERSGARCFCSDLPCGARSKRCERFPSR